MTKPKILITRRWPESVERALQAQYEVQINTADYPLTKEDLQQALCKYDALCPCVADSLNAEVFALEPDSIKTRIIGNYGVGYNHIDIDAAKRLGITVTNTPDVLSDATADLAMTLMLMLARRAGEWRLVRLVPHTSYGSINIRQDAGNCGYGKNRQSHGQKSTSWL